ncbi:MAG: phosphoribosylaminoimidazole synthetase [Arcobacter sp.]|nr:MAG: phosphoribosylaminoimidazole synthetase [Arcobacter sp.]
MLSEKIQRIMMGSLLTVILYLFNIQEIMIASYLLTAVIMLVFVWAVFDFCPSLWVLRKILKEEKCQVVSVSKES